MVHSLEPLVVTTVGSLSCTVTQERERTLVCLYHQGVGAVELGGGCAVVLDCYWYGTVGVAGRCLVTRWSLSLAVQLEQVVRMYG